MTLKRKAYCKRADIPAQLLRRFNRGQESPVSLAEWLAVDSAALMAAVLPDLGLGEFVANMQEVCTEADGTMARLRAIGVALHEIIDGQDDAAGVYDAMASHRCSVVREWAAMVVSATRELSLGRRLVMMRRFAGDENMCVREIAWASYRPFLVADLPAAVELLVPWVRDDDPLIRRCAVESTRPRGVWCQHIAALKEAPEMALPLLDPVRSDADRYVQKSVANWLNDASKTRAEWVQALCDRWRDQSPTKDTAWITNHALRTLRKKTTRKTQ